MSGGETIGVEVVSETDDDRLKSRFKLIVRSAMQYSAGSLITIVGSILRVGVAARVLSDTENGAWLGLQLLLNYGTNAHLGSLFGAYRSVPLLRAKGESADALREKETAFGVILVASVAAVVALGVLAPIVTGVNAIVTLALASVYLVVNLLRSYFVTMTKADSRFKELSVGYALGGIVTLPSLAFVIFWKLNGLLLAMAVPALVETSYLVRHAGIPRPNIDRLRLRTQLRVGGMTVAITVTTLMLTTADRTTMLRLCGPEATGLYYIGANIVALLPSLTSLPLGVLTPQFFEAVGRGDDIYPFVERPMKVMSFVVAGVVGIGAALLPTAVHHVWPNHVAGLSAAIVALFSTSVTVLAGLVTNVYYALDRQGGLVVIVGGSSLLAFAAAGVGIHLWGGAIVGAVVGSALVMIIMHFVSITVAMSLMGKTRAAGLRLAATSLVPTACVAGAVTCVSLIVPGWYAGTVGGAMAMLASIALLLGCFVPVARR
ncbi:hypothetical protein AKJ09_07804 [Labilithrix luteola]|uniref:Polysaccharide biosynthesis protein n=1 Tax=Labilithrix luteola TaxID=1391654 RepID=A0A0K1Q5N6_9BACT|nr:hypothetical protein [Labilithrix luteola]AKV01141.1 hypothetical protein AKJ09_07804 [Labilithrix luteola]